MLAARLALVAPGKDLALEPSPGRELPLGLGQQARAGPGAVGLRIGPGDVHDGMVVTPVDR